MASQVVKVEDPPKSVLREAFNWFAHKADPFADEFTRAAGKTTGAAAGVGVGVTGNLPKLVTAIDRVLQHLT